MRRVILDTSFVLTCTKQKIDFFETIENLGMKAIIPEQTIKELKGLGASTSLKILEKNKFDLVSVSGKDADTAIIKLAEEDSSLIVATLDKEIKKKIKNRKMIIRGKKKIEVI